MKYRFLVEGMSCAICSAAVEKVVLRQPGVLRASVNLLGKTLFCECEKQVRPEDIIARVESAGFSAALKTREKERTKSAEPSTHVRLVISMLLLLPLLYLSMGEMLSLPLPACLQSTALSAWIQTGVCLSVLSLNFGFFVRGVRALLRGDANMDTLVSMGSSAAFLYSLFSLLLFSFGARDTVGHLYLDGAAMIVTLVSLGKRLEERAKRKTASALQALADLLPNTVRVLRKDQVFEIAASELGVGETVLVFPGERIPVDAVVAEGQSTLDTSTLTGESLPRDISAGDAVTSGSINLSGALTLRATKCVEESTLSQMIALVEEAGVTRAPVARLADRVARIFVPTVSGLALLAVVLWWAGGYGFSFAFERGISVLVISCPCALGLATPVAVTAALGNCASRGVLVRDAAVFDHLVSCNTVLFDKTGTLTAGSMQVSDVFSVVDEREFLILAASLEQKSTHPLARAVCQFVTEPLLEISDFREVFGRGVECVCDNARLLGGNRAFLSEHGVDVSSVSEEVRQAEELGKTVLYFARDTLFLGALALSDVPKQNAETTVRALKSLPVRVAMLTGDSRPAAEYVARTCEIEEVYFEVLPQEKERVVRSLQESGCHVAMVGDGINDAPSLVRAEVGISVGSGTDIAQNSADVLLLSDDLSLLPELFAYAKRVHRIVRENLFWAFFYNCLMIPLAAGAFYLPFHLVLNPMIAASCMSLSSLFVVTNALRLYRRKGEKR